MTTLQIETAALTARDYLITWGTANGWDIPDALKRRDPKEPGRRVKEKSEDELYRIFRQYFSRQKKFVRGWLEFKYPGRKALIDTPLAELNGMYGDDTINAQVLKWLLKALKNGFIIFDDMNLIGIDYTLANVAAAKYARKYATKLIDFIDVGTRANIKEAIGTFIETPGFTVGDVMKSMDPSWGEARALRVAVTETTTAFAQAEKIAGEELQKEFPEERVIKQWWTNHDDLVCDICRPNHEKIALLDGIFPSGHSEPPAHVNCRCWYTTSVDIVGDAVLWDEVAREKIFNKYNNLRPMGNSLIVDNIDDATVKRHLSDLNRIPPNIYEDLQRGGYKFYVGTGNFTDFNDLQKYANIKPRGWPKGMTWKNVGGGFVGDKKYIVLGKGQHGSASLSLHETAHAIDKMGGLSSNKKGFGGFWLKNKHTLKNPYYLQGGKAGMEETFAEAFVETILGLPSTELKPFVEYINQLLFEGVMLP